MKQEMLPPAETNYRQVTAPQLQAEFLAITPDEMDRMPDHEILEKFGFVQIVPESSEGAAHAAQTTVKEDVTTEATVENARKNVTDALEATAPGLGEASMADMRTFASAKAKQLRQENPHLSIAEANDRAIAYTKEHFGITKPKPMRPETPAAKVQEAETAARESQPGSLAAIVKENVTRNRQETGYVSDYERGLLRLTRNRTEAFQPLEPEMYDRFTDEQLNQIKSNLLDSLAAESLRLKPEKLGEQHDLNPRIEEITQNLIALQLQMRRRQDSAPTTPVSEAQAGTEYYVRLPDEDVNKITEAIPIDSDSLVPIYEEYCRMNAIFGVARDPLEVQAIASRMHILHEVSVKLMLRKAKGWDHVSMSNLRQILAHDHPGLK